MKKRTLLLSVVFVFALVAIVNSAAIAQDQAHQNLKDMSELLKCRLDGIQVIELVSFFERESGKILLDPAT